MLVATRTPCCITVCSGVCAVHRILKYRDVEPSLKVRGNQCINACFKVETALVSSSGMRQTASHPATT